jgi:hypothetical protein
MARDLADLARSASATADALQVAQKIGVRKAALHVTTAIRLEIRKVTGDMKLSGVGRRGARVGAKYDIKGTVNPTAFITATGPLHLIERDTSPHRVPRNRRSGRKRYAVIGGHPYDHADHPGTAGKHPFERGWMKSGIETPEIFQQEIRKAIRQAWL